MFISPPFALFFCSLLGLLLVAQTPAQPQPAPAASKPLHVPLQVPMPVSATRIQIYGLPSACETATLQLQSSDPLLPGSQTLTRAVALSQGGGPASHQTVTYAVEFLLGTGMAPQIYGPQQVSLSCSPPLSVIHAHWHNPKPLPINHPDINLNLNSDFVPFEPSAQQASLQPSPTPASQSAEKALRTTAALCRQAAAPRFFEEQGGNYALSFNGGPSVEIIGRKSWGAGPAIPAGRSWQPYPAQASVCSWFRRITVHHTHTALSITALQKYHQNQADPKADIAYHFYIPASGEIYEARPLGYLGSHSERDNGHNLGIVLNGDFSKNAPSPQQLSALRNLLSALRCPCGFSDGVWTHQQRKHLTFKGDPAHSTECPGKELAQEVYGMATELGYGPLTDFAFDSAQGTGTKTRATPPP